MTARLLLEYDGTRFSGWARQTGRRTVQDEVERALGILARQEVPVTVAGRTDAGVHAWGQVVSFEGEPPAIPAINGILPADVAVIAAEPAPDGFNARFDATARTYCYRVWTRRARSVRYAGTALHHPQPLDRDALHGCAAALAGTHDFTAFTPTDTEHVRFERDVAFAHWREDGDLLEFWIQADAFMRNMNRVLVGTMLEVARGRRSVESFVALLDGAPRSAAGATALPHGLALVRVSYPDGFGDPAA